MRGHDRQRERPGAGPRRRSSPSSRSTPKEVYDEIIPAFTKTPVGRGVRFSPEPPATRLAPSSPACRPTSPRCRSSPTSRSSSRRSWSTPIGTDADEGHREPFNRRHRRAPPVTRKNIKGWADLVKPGVDVLTPNPFTSGGARWNVMAAYGAQIEQGKTEAQAIDYLSKLFKKSPSRTSRLAGRCRTSPAARATRSSPTRTRRSPPSRRANDSTTSFPTRRS